LPIHFKGEAFYPFLVIFYNFIRLLSNLILIPPVINIQYSNSILNIKKQSNELKAFGKQTPTLAPSTNTLVFDFPSYKTFGKWKKKTQFSSQ
jgi:hypothetical protein